MPSKLYLKKLVRVLFTVSHNLTYCNSLTVDAGLMQVDDVDVDAGSRSLRSPLAAFIRQQGTYG